MADLNRIEQQERNFDQAQALFERLDSLLEEVDQLPTLLSSLEAYYETDWRADFEADERGELPATLKRGILSEDGLYNLLTEQVSLVSQLRALADSLEARHQEGEGKGVRKAELADAPSLNQLSREELGYSVELAVTEEQLSKLLTHPEHVILVAEQADGQVVGYLHACAYQALFSQPYLNIMGLAVSHQVQGQGYGRQLIEALETIGRRDGYEGIRLNSGISREAAHQFYRALGYTQRDDQKRFYKLLD